MMTVAEMADDVFDHDHRALDDHAEVERSQREQIGGNVVEVEADGGEEKRERDGDGDDERAAGVPEEEKQDDGDEDDTFGEVFEDGVGGELQQVAAVQEGNDLDSLGKDVVVEFLDLVMDTDEHAVGVVALMQEDYALDDIAVVDELAVGAADGFADLAKADLGAFDYFGDVRDLEGGAVLGLEDGLRDVVGGGEEAHLADVDLLLSLLDEAAAGVGIVGGDLLFDLGDGEPVGDEFFGIEDDLVFLRNPAETGDIDDAGHAAELLFKLPILDGLQFHGAVARVCALEGVPVDLADGAPVGAHLGLKSSGQRYLRQALENLGAVPVVGALVIEDHGDAGESGQRCGAQMGHVGDAGDRDFERDGDLLLDLFGGAARPLRDDVDVVVGDVGVGLDGEVMKGDGSPAEQQHGGDQDDEAVVERPVDELCDHC